MVLRTDFEIIRLGLKDLFPVSKYQSSFNFLSAKSSLSSINKYYRHTAPSAPVARKMFTPCSSLYSVTWYSVLWPHLIRESQESISNVFKNLMQANPERKFTFLLTNLTMLLYDKRLRN